MPFAAMAFSPENPFLHLSFVDTTFVLYVSILSKLLLTDQIQVQTQQMEQQTKQMEQQSQQHREEMHNLLKILDVQKHGTGEDDSSIHHPQLSTAAIPPFATFDSSELWPDYWSRFCTFVVASAVSEQRQAQVFLKLFARRSNVENGDVLHTTL